MFSSKCKLIFGMVPSNLRHFSNENLRVKAAAELKNIAKKVKLTGSQIEQYKTQLYEMIKQRRGPSSSTSSNSSSAIEEVNKLTRFLIEECEPSLHLFNVILKGQLMLRNVEGIKETLLLIAKNKFAFNSVTLNLLLVYYRDLDMMEEAGRLFEAIKSGGKDSSPLINCAGPNLSAYTTMIAGWARRGDFKRAKEYFEMISSDSNLTPDEHATCAMINAAIGTGHLQYAKEIYESIREPSFVTLKLWLRATFQLGGYEEAFKKLKESSSSSGPYSTNSLELSEMIKWILTDLKEDNEKLFRVSLYILEAALKTEIRIGDPQCLHFLLDSLKTDPSVFSRLCRLSLQHPEKVLPIIGSRLVHQSVATKSIELASELVGQCERLGIKIPSGLLNDFKNIRK